MSSYDYKTDGGVSENLNNDELKRFKENFESVFGNAQSVLENIVRDYLRMGLDKNFPNGWKEDFEKEVDKGYKDQKTKNSFAQAWTDINNKGIDKYEVNDMDATTIFAVLRSKKFSCCVYNSKLKGMLNELRKGRNVFAHEKEKLLSDFPNLHIRVGKIIDDCLSFVLEVKKLDSKDDEKDTFPDEGVRNEYQEKYRKSLNDLKTQNLNTYGKYCGWIYMKESNSEPSISDVKNDKYLKKNNKDRDRGIEVKKLDGRVEITKEVINKAPVLKLLRHDGKIQVKEMFFWCVSDSGKAPESEKCKRGADVFKLEKDHIGKYVHGYISAKGYSGRLEAKHLVSDSDFEVTKQVEINETSNNDDSIDDNRNNCARYNLSIKCSDHNPQPKKEMIIQPCLLVVDNRADIGLTDVKHTWVFENERVNGYFFNLREKHIDGTVTCIAKIDDKDIGRAEYKVKREDVKIVKLTGELSIDSKRRKNETGECITLIGRYSDEKVPGEKTWTWYINGEKKWEEKNYNLSEEIKVDDMVELSVETEYSIEPKKTEAGRIVDLLKNENEECKDSSADKHKKVQIKELPKEGVIDISKKNLAIKQPYEIRRLPDSERQFFATKSLVQYFVRPNDYFALNSLELVSADEYLYRLLKRNYYEYIYFFEATSSTQHNIFTFDKQSVDGFWREKGKKHAAGLQGLTTIKTNKIDDDNKKAKSTFSDGKRVILSFHTPEEFVKHIATSISHALDNKKHKTAVVMPLLMMSQGGFITDETINEISALSNRNKNNVLIFTMEDINNIQVCFENPQRKIHDWIYNARGMFGNKSLSTEEQEKAISTLLNSGRILIADRYGEDEIGNLLFRKILIEGNRQLAQIGLSRVYAVAEYLYREFYRIRKQSERLHQSNEERKITRKDIFTGEKELIDNLDRVLDDTEENKERIDELIKKTKGLKSVCVGYSKKLNPLQIERVYHDHYDRYDSDNSREEIMDEFARFSGKETQEIISHIKGLVDFLSDERARIDERKRNGIVGDEMPYMNMVFLGNPGTGKTTLAKMTAKYMKTMGVLPTDRFEYITASAETNGTVNITATNIRDAAQRAFGGVLMIDEFQGFDHAYDGGNVAKEAMEAIVGIVNNHRDDLCIIIAGYKDGVESVLKHDQGADRRFPEKNRFLFKDYSTDTLMEILYSMIEKRGETIETDANDIIRTVIENRMADDTRNFGNAGYVESELIPALIMAKSNRAKGSKCITAEDVRTAFPNVKSIKISKEEILKRFDNLFGEEMKHVKEQIVESIDMLKDRKKRLDEMRKKGEEVSENAFPYMNMVFEGGPGTGKTTVAKLTAKYLRIEGILSTDRYKYITATRIVEGTVGETGKRIREAAEEARGGVLFIDEFQGFDKGHSNGNMAQDAMTEIVSIINDHRDDLCIILAGYKKGVDKVLSFDEGAGRRFPKGNRIEFQNYSVDTLMQIMDFHLHELGLKMDDDDARQQVRIVIDRHKSEGEKKGTFGNGGYISDDLIPALDKKRIKRADKTGAFIKQDVIDAFPEILGGKIVGQTWEHKKLRKAEMDKALNKYEMKQRNQKELQEITDSSILYITTENCQGTAFLIHPDGYALTCNHVIKDSKDIKARVRIKGREGGDDTWHKCVVVNAKEDLDLAVIKLDGSNFPYLPLATKEIEIHRGDDVLLSGYPFGKKLADGINTFQEKISSDGVHFDQSNYKRYFIDNAAKSGNSGSPIIALDSGLVIGVLAGSVDNQSTASKTEEINFMRPVYYFWEEFVK